MTEEEIEELAEAVADKIKEESSTAVLILHSIPEAEGLGGIVVNPEVAARTPCTCYGNICFSPGIMGALSKAEKQAYCPSTIEKTSPKMTERLEKWNEAKTICKQQADQFPKGERLIPYIQCMGLELPKRGIAI